MSRTFDANISNYLSYAIATGQPLPVSAAGPGFTMGAYVKTSTASLSGAVCGVFDVSSTSFPRTVLRVQAGNAASFSNPSATSVSATYNASPVPLGEWTPCLLTFDTVSGDDTLYIYMGNESQFAISTGELNHSNNQFIDSFQVGRFGDSTPNEPFDGLIAHPVVWNESLSEAQIAAFFAATSQADIEAIAAANMWGYWPLDTSNGLNDVSGNARHLTENGTVTLSADDPFAASGPTHPFTSVTIS